LLFHHHTQHEHHLDQFFYNQDKVIQNFNVKPRLLDIGGHINNVLKICLVLILKLTMTNILCVKYDTFGNCLSCFAHQSKRFSISPTCIR
jgi:hypothetical protein